MGGLSDKEIGGKVFESCGSFSKGD